MRSKGHNENNDIKLAYNSSLDRMRVSHKTPIEAFHNKVKKRRAAKRAAKKARAINR